MKKTTLATLVITLAAGSAFAATPVNAPAGTPGGPTAPVSGEHKGPGGPGGPGAHMFEETDTDHDGAISKAEWTAKGDKMFADIDANHDGKITKEEMKAHWDMERAKHERHEAEHGGEFVKTPAANAAPKN